MDTELRIIKSNYAQIDEQDRLIRLFSEKPKNISAFTTMIENAVVKIDKYTLTIEGNEFDFGLTLDREFIEDMTNKPMQSCTKLGYKTIIDFLKGIKKPYVPAGWFLYEKTIPYKIVLSEWALRFIN